MPEFRSVSLSLGGRAILERFDFSLEEKTRTAILGTSGCGKTTLLRLAAGLQKPDSGAAEPFSGKPSFLFQDDRLVPWSDALENLTILGIPQERAREYLAKVGLAGEEGKLPEELSGGMKRRLAVARCFAYGGDAFYLDEPLQGLDLKTAGDVLAFMAGELSGKSALLITHNPEEALALADRVVIVTGPPLRVVSDRPASAFEDPDELKAALSGK
ncbi:MAG TPA: ATP-binding cassette domain-containing protein [Oscillospiraceae bacterium]|nr:ATP-binding cassette domain-containing protein [Oscillospiraceae bacterium]HNW05124.1 ATP-binding cassette domain-containing protein [Oscillospiraceae bacterium]